MTLPEYADVLIHRALHPVVGPRRLVTICGWCPDVERRTAEARQTGADVSHGMCPVCVERFERGQVA